MTGLQAAFIRLGYLTLLIMLVSVAGSSPKGPWEATAETTLAPAAVGAGAASWSGDIVLQNEGSDAASVVINFYSTTGSLVKSYPLPSPVPSKGSVTVRTIDIPDLPNGYAGSATVSSSQPVTANFVAYDASNANVDAAIYTGFNQGSNLVYVPAISNNYADQTSTLAVQNTEDGPVSVTIRYYERFTGALSATVADTIPAQASHYYDSSKLPTGAQLPPPWSGAAFIEASGKVAAVVHQPYLTSNKAVAFEGSGQATNQVFLPSALFQYGPQSQTSFIAIENTQGDPVSLTMTFYSKDGQAAGSLDDSIDGFRKKSWNPGSVGLASGFSGSAVIRASAPVVAVVNIGTSSDAAMAYTGQGKGSIKQVLPFIHWSQQSDPRGWRTFIAVLNADPSTPANVTLRYYDTNGGLTAIVSLPSIAPFTKGNHNPGAVVGDAPFIGTVEVQADRPVVALVNAITVDNQSADSYTGIPVQ